MPKPLKGSTSLPELRRESKDNAPEGSRRRHISGFKTFTCHFYQDRKSSHDAGCQQVTEEKGQVSQLFCETCGLVTDLWLQIIFVVCYWFLHVEMLLKNTTTRPFHSAYQVQPDGAAALRRSALNMGLPPQLRLGCGIDIVDILGIYQMMSSG